MTTPLSDLLIQMLKTDSPALLTLIAACYLAIEKRKLLGRAALWALLGFGLLLACHILAPIGLTYLMEELSVGGKLRMDGIDPLVFFRVFSSVVALVAGVGMICLLVAIQSGRRGRGNSLGIG